MFGSSEQLIPIPREIEVMLGPPPVLSRRAAALHKLLFMGLAQTIKPTDVIEWMYVRDAADYRIRVFWTRKLIAKLIDQPKENAITERGHQIFETGKLRIRKMEDELKSNLAAKIKALKGEPAEVDSARIKLETEVEEKIKLRTEEIECESDTEVKKVEASIPINVGDALTFGAWIGDVEQAQKLLREYEQGYERALAQLDAYKHGLGERLRHAANQILEGRSAAQLLSEEDGQHQSKPAKGCAPDDLGGSSTHPGGQGCR